MADRRTRYAKGLKNITLYGTTSLDSSATFAGRGAASVEAMVCGVASGDTSFDGIKIAYGHKTITGSQDINTGLTTVYTGGANISNTTGGLSTTPQTVQVRVPKVAAGVSGSKGAGYMKIVVKGCSASVEASSAASIDWFAIGQ